MIIKKINIYIKVLMEKMKMIRKKIYLLQKLWMRVKFQNLFNLLNKKYRNTIQRQKIKMRMLNFMELKAFHFTK